MTGPDAVPPAIMLGLDEDAMNIDDKRDKPLPQIAREACAVQDASNLRGVLLSWHKAICQDAVARGGQIEEYLNLLYLGKVCALMHAKGWAYGDAVAYSADGKKETTFGDAYEWAVKVQR